MSGENKGKKKTYLPSTSLKTGLLSSKDSEVKRRITLKKQTV